MILLYFCLSYVLVVNKTNAKSVLEESYKIPVLMLIYSPHCPHCTAVHPTWIELMETYETDSKILIGECNAIEHRSECKSLFSYNGYPTFIIISRGRSKEFSPKRTIESFVEEAERVKRIDYSIPCAVYQSDFDQKYPAFILTNDEKSDKKCQTLQKIIDVYPQAKPHLYINSTSSKIESFVALSSSENSVKFEGQKDVNSLIDFMRDFMLTPFGEWNYSEASYSNKRIGLLIHSSHSEYMSFLKEIKPFFNDFALCKIDSDYFMKLFPKFSFNKANLPAFAISNANKTSFLILVNVLRNNKFFSKVSKAVNGTTDQMAKYDLSPLFPIVERRVKREKIVEINKNVNDEKIDKKNDAVESDKNNDDEAEANEIPNLDDAGDKSKSKDDNKTSEKISKQDEDNNENNANDETEANENPKLDDAETNKTGDNKTSEKSSKQDEAESNDVKAIKTDETSSNDDDNKRKPRDDSKKEKKEKDDDNSIVHKKPTRTSIPSRLATTNFKVFLVIFFIVSFSAVFGIMYYINNAGNKIE